MQPDISVVDDFRYKVSDIHIDIERVPGRPPVLCLLAFVEIDQWGGT